MSTIQSDDLRFMNRAATLGARGLGLVEPNPLVGSVIVDPRGTVVGTGWHKRFGQSHAEINALDDCKRRGHSSVGATMYVTLEPCNHTGKTQPCTQAIIESKIARCVIARSDPTPRAGGGANVLRDAGVQVDFIDAPRATRLTDSFVKRETKGLPWVLAKWASSVDGRIALPSGESKWISHPRSRTTVHRMRARMDAILTGIGTVHADDPMLTPRHVINRLRMPKRIVVDPQLSIPMDCRLVSTVKQAPTFVAALPEVLARNTDRVTDLQSAGVGLIPTPPNADGQLDLTQLLKTLVASHGVTRLMVEAGGGLVGQMISARLIDEIMIYLAPRVLGGSGPHSPTRSLQVQSMDSAPSLKLRRVRRIADDVELNYRFVTA